MTLDEVIEHANRVADSYKDTAPACKSAHEYRQLADWLTELKVLRTENAELRELLRDMYMRFHGAVIENWSYSSEDFYMYEQLMCELGIEVDE